MKSFFTILFALIITLPLLAQDEDERDEEDVVYVHHRTSKRWNNGEIKTISRSHYHSGGFGAVSFRGSEFMNESLILAGFRGGWIINRSLAIGVEGHGVVPTAEFDNVRPDRNGILLGGYGGMFLEPIFFSNELIHVTFPISGGAGWLGFHDDWEEDDSNNQNPGQQDSPEEIIEDDVFWYVEPGIAAELNVARHFRIALGVSKRFTQDLDLEFSDADDFENLNYFMTLKFGRF
ncbi:hypothetical protein FNH22_04015 [Fulvivirga sp. M361]|uniref:hypothetical protein n=1 Tax=Fulvivirga sp. M361 TaxID=2594266 RepID=UPI0011798A6F|nr:hypothetical protein [Fulvivirga sp. M361]TRX61229.1 hypothetical protein FNH22_04015 [Fulvivirga sp. M361]